MKIVILASGNGSNAQAIIDKTSLASFDIEITSIISNKPEAQVLRRAAKANIPTEIIEPKNFSDRASYDKELLRAIRASHAECVALAGYMLLLSREFLEDFSGPVLNIHPSLLPAFPGTKGIQDACEYGVKLTGVTVHYVSEEMDKGPIIIQACLPVFPRLSIEELTGRIHQIEHRIYPQALQWLATNRITIDGRCTSLVQTGLPLARIPENCLVWPPLEEGF